MNKKEIIKEMLKNRELDNFKIKDLIEIISYSPTLKNQLNYEIWSSEEQEILRKKLLDICYKVIEMENNNAEICLERLKNFGKKSVNKTGKHSKDKNLEIINIKTHSKEDALSQLKKLLPKEVYERIKKEMI